MLKTTKVTEVSFQGIRAIPSAGYNSTDGGVNSAVLRYAGAPAIEPTSTSTENPVKLNEANVVVSTIRSFPALGSYSSVI